MIIKKQGIKALLFLRKNHQKNRLFRYTTVKINKKFLEILRIDNFQLTPTFKYYIILTAVRNLSAVRNLTFFTDRRDNYGASRHRTLAVYFFDILYTRLDAGIRVRVALSQASYQPRLS